MVDISLKYPGIVKAGTTIYCDGPPIQRTGKAEPTGDGVCLENVATGRGTFYSNVTSTERDFNVENVNIQKNTLIIR